MFSSILQASELPMNYTRQENMSCHSGTEQLHFTCKIIACIVAVALVICIWLIDVFRMSDFKFYTHTRHTRAHALIDQ